MAMFLSSLSSHILVTATLGGPHHLTLDAHGNTQCIPRLFSTLNNRSSARKHGSIYLRSSARKHRSIYLRTGSRKIIACVGEDSTSLSNDSDKKKTVKSEGEHVDVNPNVSEAPSSSSSIDAAKSDLIRRIKHIDQADGKKVDVNLDALVDCISELLKLREKEMLPDEEASNSSNFPWPEGFKKLNAILSCGTDLKNLNELLSSGLDFASTMKKVISGPVKTILEDIGQASVVTAGLLVVATTLEKFHDLSDNNLCWILIKEMSQLASVVKSLHESPRRLNGSPKETVNVIKEATTLVVEGAIMCCTQLDSSGWKSFFSTTTDKADLSGITQKLHFMYLKISVDIGFSNSTAIAEESKRNSTNSERLLAAIQSKRNHPVSRIYPDQAVGIEDSIKYVVSCLEIESDDQNAVTVILHDLDGMGKTTLADAVVSKDTVVSKLVGFKYSKVQMCKDSVIVNLQKEILEDLMGSGDTISKIKTHQDGQRELRKRLEQVEAFIYIDDVLDGDALQELLPEDMSCAKKVRLLLTANKDVKYACPRPCTEPKICTMKKIQEEAALTILKREIKDGINESQFSEIIRTCDGIPLMLKLAARFIGRAPKKQEAYSTLVLQEDKLPIEAFGPMHCAFAYDALPPECKDPFLDICSYFKGWDWEAVEDIVGKDELKMLESRALVTRATNDVASVHNVILRLARQKSKEGKEVRLAFTSASKLAEFLKAKGAEEIKGIWLSDNNKDPLKISAATLDFMSKSLRVLRLGNAATLLGKCSEIFEALVFFEGKFCQLPFHDVSMLTKLRYLSYRPNDQLKLSKMPSSLRHMELNGTSLSDAFKIYSNDLQKLEHLRILRLLSIYGLKNLPKKLGDQLKGLHELSLSNCRFITKLPDSISKHQSLRVLKMDGCSRLTELPVDFGSLSSLRELHLHGCWKLEALPYSAEKLSSLTLLNLSDCYSLKSIPKGIGKLKLLRALGVSRCWTLTELPDGLCKLSFITHLSFEGCNRLEKLPDEFGQLASLKMLLFTGCSSLQKLPESFRQLKNLEVLDLGYCSQLEQLCNDFHWLSSLQNLALNNCEHLEKLPKYFHCLTSLQRLDLSWCTKLEAKSIDHVLKINTLQLVDISGSGQLYERCAEIQRDGGGSWSFRLTSGKDLSMVEKENIEKRLLLELDGLLTNRRGEQFYLSHLPPNTLILVLWDLQPDNSYNIMDCRDFIEDMIDEMQIEVIYIGPHFDNFSTQVQDNIFVVDVPTTRATQMLQKVHLTLDLALDHYPKNAYLRIDTRMKVGDEYRPCWRFLRQDEMVEFVLSNCKRYLRLKQLQAERDEESSNIELLTELFAAQKDEITPVFQKNESSVQQDPTANSEVKATCGVDKLEGKTVLLEMRPAHSFFYDIRFPSLKEMYLMEKERLNFEIISIPLVQPLEDVFDVYKQFSREVPWLVLQNSWLTIAKSVQYFLATQCSGWENCNQFEKWYPAIIWIIDPYGRITIYRPPLSPGDMGDRGEVFEVFFNYLESESYQVRWGVNASLTTLGKIEEVRKNEWQQLKNMSALEFLFNHLESVSVQVKSLMRQGKFICLYSGHHADGITYFIRSAMEHFRDNIHFIHFSHEVKWLHLTYTNSKDYYHPLENTTEMEGTSLLNLSRHDTLRFIMRLDYLEEEMNGMDQSDKRGCLNDGSITFFDQMGKMVATFRREYIRWIFNEPDRKDTVQRLINSMFKEEMHDEDSSLIKKMQTASAAAVEQQNADVYFDALRDYISELWGVELYQLCKLTKEGKKRSPPRVTWPTSRGLCRLKNFLSEGANEDWVKDSISHPNYPIKSLVKDIEEAEWAVAGLLAVADLLERFETVPSDRIEWLFILETMFRLAQYSKHFNQKAELWRRMKCGAIVFILIFSIMCCCAIDPSKFAFTGFGGSEARKWLMNVEKILREECKRLAHAMTEGLDNESGSLADLYCYRWSFHAWPESEDEGGPSERSASTREEEGEGSAASTREEEEEGGSAASTGEEEEGSAASTGEEE